MVFIDTNVRVYALSSQDHLKKDVAIELMIAAANKAGCSTMYTEDLNDGQKYGNVVAINPFK